MIKEDKKIYELLRYGGNLVENGDWHIGCRNISCNECPLAHPFQCSCYSFIRNNTIKFLNRNPLILFCMNVEN